MRPERVRVEEPPKAGGFALLGLAFRPFFLLGALFSILSLGLWGAILAGAAEPHLYGGAYWWHAHEMLFGFVAAIVVGFLLTAVQTWTGIPGLRGLPLAALVALWLAARTGMVFGGAVAPWLLALLDLLFLPAAMTVLAVAVVRVRQWRNIVFVPVLLLMTLANAAMHWAAVSGDSVMMATALRAMVLLMTLLMTIIAGRVVPMFTANGTGTPRVPDLPWLERSVLASTLICVLTGVASPWLPPVLVAAAFTLTAALHALRVWRWRTWLTLAVPLVWSLHLSYWCIPLGLLLYGLSGVPGAVITQTQAIHTLTVGGMGLMILAMMSRVSLGHTGRPLSVGTTMALAFACVFAAFALRVFGGLFVDNYIDVMLAAITLWALGYGCFCIRYFHVLTRSRVDGRPG